MADFKRHMSGHLGSAKQWLTRAEESFDKDSNIRGELDLFLAQAELQRARETNSSRQWRYRYPVLRHALSLIAAMSIVAVGFGAFWWSSGTNMAVPAAPVAQETKNMPAVNPGSETAASPMRTESPQPAAAAVSVTPPQMALPPVERPEKAERARPSEKENLLPPDEMQKIIRAAGKSLRGQ
jgi:hypothetical protein